MSSHKEATPVGKSAVLLPNHYLPGPAASPPSWASSWQRAENSLGGYNGSARSGRIYPDSQSLNFWKVSMRCLKLLQRPWVALFLVLLIAAVPLACGGTADAPVATPAPTIAASPTEVPPTSVPTAAPEESGQTFTFPAMPAWVANGKYQPMILQGINGTNPGQWDVHSCGSLSSCLTPSSLQFNGLVYHDPNDPIEVICDLCESWEGERRWNGLHFHNSRG